MSGDFQTTLSKLFDAFPMAFELIVKKKKEIIKNIWNEVYQLMC